MTLGYNQPITFGRDGNAVGLNCNGIDFSEHGHQSWTCAPVAELDVQLPFARRDVLVRVEASPFIVPPAVSVQNIFIFLGGLFVGYYGLRAYGVREFPVSRGVVSGRATRLALVLPNAASPHALALSEDLRELGVYLSSITFKTAA